MNIDEWYEQLEKKTNTPVAVFLTMVLTLLSISLAVMICALIVVFLEWLLGGFGVFIGAILVFSAIFTGLHTFLTW